MEYKEEFAELNDVEETVEKAEETQEMTETTQSAEVTEEKKTEEQADDFVEETLKQEDAVQETDTETKWKKKFPIYVPIIIAACVLVGAIVAFFAVNIFVPTVEGTWLYEAEDGNSFYYNFDKKVDKNVCEMSIGTIYFPGTYTEEANSVSVEVYAGYIYGNFTYDITGVSLFGNRVLTLTGEDGSTFTLTQTKQPKDKDYITPDKDFEEVKELTGVWIFEYPDYNSPLKLTFNSDGTLIYDQFGMQELHCVYSATDSVITLSFFETDVVSQEEGYYFNGDELVFLGLNWTRADKSTADEAK